MNLSKLEYRLEKLAMFSDHAQHKIACIIMDKNKIVSFGFNMCRTHPKSNHPYKSLHAECSSLIGIPLSKTKGCTAVVYRQNKQGLKSIARPCPSCQLALKLAGIKKVCYTDAGSWKEEYL